MKVKELIKLLQKVDENLEVCGTDHERGDSLITKVTVAKYYVEPYVPYVKIE